MGLMATCDELATLITPELNNLQAKSQQVSLQQVPGRVLRRHPIPNTHSPPVTRLVNRRRVGIRDGMPAEDPSGHLLEGDLLRFCL